MSDVIDRPGQDYGGTAVAERPTRTPARGSGDEVAPRPGPGSRRVGADLRGLDLTKADLRGADLSRANLAGVRLAGADLTDAVLFEADLSGCELVGARLVGANLTDCKADGAGFGGADLERATLFGASLRGATLTKTRLVHADLRSARLDGARLREADLSGADLSLAVLSKADLCKSEVSRASFGDADLREARLRGMTGYALADWIGGDIFGVDFTGAYLVRREIADQNYLHEFRNQSRANAALYWVWWATSDCGRSFVRWGLWTIFLAMVFAGLFELVALDRGAHATPLSTIYFSVVTLSTLGYGDVLPASPAAQVLAMVEVVLGYVMLGGLLSIFANKMARRAD